MATQIPQLPAQSRPRLGTRTAARERNAGLLPAVIYGHKQEPAHITINRKAFTQLAHNNVHLLEVKLGNKAEPCLIKEVQWDHLGSHLVHVDLARVDLNEKVRFKVSVVLTGEPVGCKETGAYLQPFATELEIECLATQIPDNIKVDVSPLKVDETILAKAVKLPEGVVLKSDPDMPIAGVLVVLEEEVAAPAAEGATAEPEVIGRKPGEEGEGEEGAAAAAKPGAAAPKADAKKK